MCRFLIGTFFFSKFVCTFRLYYCLKNFDTFMIIKSIKKNIIYILMFLIYQIITYVYEINYSNPLPYLNFIIYFLTFLLIKDTLSKTKHLLQIIPFLHGPTPIIRLFTVHGYLKYYCTCSIKSGDFQFSIFSDISVCRCLFLQYGFMPER